MNSKNLSKAINRMLAILLTAAMVAGSFTVPVKADVDEQVGTETEAVKVPEGSGKPEISEEGVENADGEAYGDSGVVTVTNITADAAGTDFGTDPYWELTSGNSKTKIQSITLGGGTGAGNKEVIGASVAKETLAEGGDLTFTFTPFRGYKVTAASINNGSTVTALTKDRDNVFKIAASAINEDTISIKTDSVVIEKVGYTVTETNGVVTDDTNINRVYDTEDYIFTVDTSSKPCSQVNVKIADTAGYTYAASDPGHTLSSSGEKWFEDDGYNLKDTDYALPGDQFKIPKELLVGNITITVTQEEKVKVNASITNGDTVIGQTEAKNYRVVKAAGPTPGEIYSDEEGVYVANNANLTFYVVDNSGATISSDKIEVKAYKKSDTLKESPIEVTGTNVSTTSPYTIASASLTEAIIIEVTAKNIYKVKHVNSSDADASKVTVEVGSVDIDKHDQDSDIVKAIEGTDLEFKVTAKGDKLLKSVSVSSENSEVTVSPVTRAATNTTNPNKAFGKTGGLLYSTENAVNAKVYNFTLKGVDSTTKKVITGDVTITTELEDDTLTDTNEVFVYVWNKTNKKYEKSNDSTGHATTVANYKIETAVVSPSSGKSYKGKYNSETIMSVSEVSAGYDYEVKLYAESNGEEGLQTEEMANGTPADTEVTYTEEGTSVKLYTSTIQGKAMYYAVKCLPIEKKITIDDSGVAGVNGLSVNVKNTLLGTNVVINKSSEVKTANFAKGTDVTVQVSGVTSPNVVRAVAKYSDTAAAELRGKEITEFTGTYNPLGNTTYTLPDEQAIDDVTIYLTSTSNSYAVTDASTSSLYKIYASTTWSSAANKYINFKPLAEVSPVDGSCDVAFQVRRADGTIVAGSEVWATAADTDDKEVSITKQFGTSDPVNVVSVNGGDADNGKYDTTNNYFIIKSDAITRPITLKAFHHEYSVAPSHGEDADLFITTTENLQLVKHTGANAGTTPNDNTEDTMPKAKYHEQYEFVVAKALTLKSGTITNKWEPYTGPVKVQYNIDGAGWKSAVKGSGDGVYMIPTTEPDTGNAVNLAGAVQIKAEYLYTSTVTLDMPESYFEGATAPQYLIAAADGAGYTDLKEKEYKIEYTKADITGKKIFVNAVLATAKALIYDLKVTVDGEDGEIKQAINTMDNKGNVLEHSIVISAVPQKVTLTLTKSTLSHTTLSVWDAIENKKLTPKTTSPTITYELTTTGSYYIKAERSAENIADYGELAVAVSAGATIGRDTKVTDGEQWNIPALTGATTITVTENTPASKSVYARIEGSNASAVITSENYDGSEEAIMKKSSGSVTLTATTGATASDTSVDALGSKDVSIKITPATNYVVKSVNAYDCAADGTMDKTVEYEITTSGTGSNTVYTVTGGTYPGTNIAFDIVTVLDESECYNINFQLTDDIEYVEILDGSRNALNPNVTLKESGNYSVATKNDDIEFAVYPKAGYSLKKMIVGAHTYTTTAELSSAGNFKVDKTELDDKKHKGTGKYYAVSFETEITKAAADTWFKILTTDSNIEVGEVKGFTKLANDSYKVPKDYAEDIEFTLKVKDGYRIVDGKGPEVGVAAVTSTPGKLTGIVRADGGVRVKEGDYWIYTYKMAPSLDIPTVKVGEVVSDKLASAASAYDSKMTITISSTTEAQNVKVKNVGSQPFKLGIGTGAASNVNGGDESSAFNDGDNITIVIPANYDLYDVDGTKLNDNTGRAANATQNYVFKAEAADKDATLNIIKLEVKARTDAASFKIKSIVNNEDHVPVDTSKFDQPIQVEPNSTYTVTVEGTDASGAALNYSSASAAILKVTKKGDSSKLTEFTDPGLSNTFTVTVKDSVTLVLTSTCISGGLATDTVKELTFATEDPADGVEISYNGVKVTDGVIGIEAGLENEVISIKALNGTTEIGQESLDVSVSNPSPALVAAYDADAKAITVKAGANANGVISTVIIKSKATDKELARLSIQGKARVLTINSLNVTASKTALTISAEGSATQRTGVEQYYELTVTDQMKAVTTIYNVKATNFGLSGHSISIDANAEDKFTVSAKMFEVAEGTTVPEEGAYASPLAVSDPVSKEATVPKRILKDVILSKTSVQYKPDRSDFVTVTAYEEGSDEPIELKAADITVDPAAVNGIIATKDGNKITFAGGEDKATAEFTVMVDGNTELAKKVTVSVKNRTITNVKVSPKSVTYMPGGNGKVKVTADADGVAITPEAGSIAVLSTIDGISGITYSVDDGVVTFSGGLDKAKDSFMITVDGVEADGLVNVNVVARDDEPGTPDDDPSDYEKPSEAEYKDINKSGLSIIASKAYTYTGKPIQAAVKVAANPNKLVNGTDYKITYADNVSAGKGKILVSGIGQYNGLLKDGEIEFTINPKKASGFTVVAGSMSADEAKEFDEDDAYAVNDRISVYDGTTKLWIDDDYTIESIAKSSNGKKIDFVIKGAGNYDSNTQKKASIAIVDLKGKNDIAACEISDIEDKNYTGSAIKPTVTVTDEEGNPVSSANYTVTYKNNTNRGVATVTVKGKKEYAGSKVTTFNIVSPEVDTDKDVTITVNGGKPMTYTGKLLKPSVKVQVTVNGKVKTLSKNKDYAVYYGSELNAGTGRVVIRGLGNYAEILTDTPKEFTINKADFKKVSIKKNSLKQSGVYFNNKKLVVDEDFVVISVDTSNLSKCAVTVRVPEGGSTNFQGDATKTIKGKAAQIDWAQLRLDDPSKK